MQSRIEPVTVLMQQPKTAPQQSFCGAVFLRGCLWVIYGRRICSRCTGPSTGCSHGFQFVRSSGNSSRRLRNGFCTGIRYILHCGLLCSYPSEIAPFIIRVLQNGDAKTVFFTSFLVCTIRQVLSLETFSYYGCTCLQIR